MMQSAADTNAEAGDSCHDYHDAHEHHDDHVAGINDDQDDPFQSLDPSPTSSERGASQDGESEDVATPDVPEVVAVGPSAEPSHPGTSDQGPSDFAELQEGADAGIDRSDYDEDDLTDDENRYVGHSRLQEGLEDKPEPDSKEYQDMLAAADLRKAAGNAHFKEDRHEEALVEYTAALQAAPRSAREGAIYHANSAACYTALKRYPECVASCNAALLLDAQYAKALRRRMGAHEAQDQLIEALADAKQLVDINPADTAAVQNVRKWTPIVAKRQEEMKEEVMGKLKDLGNNLLGNFGMSLDNFKMVQDPSTGGYSFNFQQ